MRATAVLLAVLVLGHFAMTHLVTDVAATDSSFVLRRWSSALWIAWDLTMLATALLHASCGMWLVIAEQAPPPAATPGRLLAVVSRCFSQSAPQRSSSERATAPDAPTERRGVRTMHKALTHNQGDHVAVAVAAIAPGEEVTVVFLDDDS